MSALQESDISDWRSTKTWTIREQNRLIALWESGEPSSRIAMRLGRTEQAINARIIGLRASGMDISYRVAPWSAEDDARVISMWRDGFGAAEIAEAVGRRRSVVTAHISHLRRCGVSLDVRENDQVRTSRPYDAEMIQRWQRNETSYVIARALGLTRSVVCKRIWDLRKRGTLDADGNPLRRGQ